MSTGKFILNLAPTGMLPTKEMTPHVPLQTGEVIDEVLGVPNVSMVHLHARDDTGVPAHYKHLYAHIIAQIRKRDPGLVLCVSTSGRNWSEFEKRSAVLELTSPLIKPDMASLTLSSLNFNRQASINEPQMIQDLAAKMLDCGIKPELEVFDLGMINYAKYLIRKGLLRPPYYFNIILGNIACAQVEHLPTMVASLPPNSYWSVGGVGDYQLRANVTGLAMGGGVRVGLEDNIYLTPERKVLATNYELVDRITGIASMMGLSVATPEEVRGWLEL